MAFNHHVHRRDSKSGNVNGADPYRLIIDGGEIRYERPPGSGNFFHADGSEVEKPKVKTAPVEAKPLAPPTAPAVVSPVVNELKK